MQMPAQEMPKEVADYNEDAVTEEPEVQTKFFDIACFKQCVAAGNDVDTCNRKCFIVMMQMPAQEMPKEVADYNEDAVTEEPEVQTKFFDIACFKQCVAAGNDVDT